VLLITALCFVGAWLLRNWQRFALRNPRGARLAILEVRPLGQRHALYVVGYERERLLLSASPTGVTLLCHLPPAVEAEPVEAVPAPAGFADTLAKALRP
jgi:flagellar biogenesis protein FliO